MWNRAMLKSRGKIAFKANYWRSVLVALIATMLVSGASSSGQKETVDSIQSGNAPSFDAFSGNGLLAAGIVGSVLLIAIVIGVGLSVFVINPLEVGCCNFFLCNRRNPATTVGAIGRSFNSNYKNIVKAQFMTKLFICLWTLLLIVPGIIKQYEYRMVPYLLAEDPDMNYHDAMETSKAVMQGNKWAAFVLDLSFIGWLILGGISFGLLNLFYVNPYIEATNAELYVTLVHPSEA